MAVKHYPGVNIPKNRSFVNPKIVSIPDVIGSFNEIPVSGDYVAIKSHPDLVNKDVYNPYGGDDFELFKKKPDRIRHFQGIVRTKDGKHIILSGGDHEKSAAQIFVCEVRTHGSKSTKEIGIPVSTQKTYYGVLKDVFKFDNARYWHNGGISVFEHVLIIPLEADGYLPKQASKVADSKIKFIDISNPLKPTDLKIDISRAGQNAGTASMIKLPNGHFLLAVWSDSDPQKRRTLDFYISKTKKLKEGFHDKKYVFFHSKNFKGNPRYQTIQLILQSDGKLFMIGNRNSYALSPIPSFKGKNRSRLYQITFSNLDLTKDNILKETVDLKILGSDSDKIYKGGGKRYNFNGGTGIYITPDSKLALYATHHRCARGGQAISCTEFYPAFNKSRINKLKDAVIELYDDKNHTDRCMRIYGYHMDKKLLDYNDLFIEEKSFNDKISSIKYQLPVGTTYKLFEHNNFQGKCIELYGTGELVKIKNIDSSANRHVVGKYKIPNKMGDKISSSKLGELES